MEQMIEKILTNGWLSPTGWFLLEHDKYHDYTNHSIAFLVKPMVVLRLVFFQVQAVDSKS